MNLPLLVHVLSRRRALRHHEAWSREDLDAHQRRALAELREYAYAGSPFYARFHKGLERAPLDALPVLTKRDLMGAFDEIVTDPRVRRSDVDAHLRNLDGDPLFLGRYRVAKTSGSTGLAGVFLSDEREWETIIASYSRAQEWAGIRANLARRTRLAVVSSRVPWHQSARVGASVDSPFIPVERFDATEPIEQIVAGLNAWQPENLIAYASMARVLAEEQLAGRLKIAPRAVMCSSEVLTQETRARVRRAWDLEPFNVYAATETAGVASECAHHRMHLFEDLVIVEAVDERHRPVPRGVAAAKMLVTVLFSRTQPLIRYEMSDRIVLSGERCDCDLPFALLDAIEGRAEDMMQLPARAGGTVSIHPNVFHRVLERFPVREWQVIQEPEAIRLVLGRPDPDADDGALVDSMKRELEAAGAATPSVRVERTDAVARTALGKAPLIRALRR